MGADEGSSEHSSEHGDVVVALPVRRICSECEHAYIGPRGTFCGFFREEVSEHIAEECEEYLPY